MSAAHTTKRHMNSMSVIVFVTCLLLVSGNAVFAEPYLMLDAKMPDGSPPPTSSEMGIFTSGQVFTLYALVNSEAPEAVSDPFDEETFFLSVAVVPDPGESFPGPDIGSYYFDADYFDGGTYDVVGDMKYGTPPLELFLKQNDLPSHGVYETYFHEYSFELNLDNKATLYNSQDFPGGPTDNPLGTLYYQAFDVDVSGLISPYQMHFDLYTKGSPYVDKSAPFSHDVTTTPVPASVILGMLGLGVVGLKLRKFA